jgi:large subunit ribosomal protein L17
MKHRVAGRKLGRTSAHRLAVLRNLSTDLFRHERVQTTLMKAKELRPFAEKLITTGKRGDVASRRRVARHIRVPDVAKKLVDTIATRFADRQGGYTRILKLGPRRGDSAEMAIIELVGFEPTFAPKEEDKKERKGIGRIRERFSRRKAAPDAGEGAEGAAEGPKKPARKAKPPKGAKAEKAEKAEKGAKPSAARGGKSASAKRAAGRKIGGSKKGS